MAKITNIVFIGYDYATITVEVEIDKGDSVLYHLQLVDILGPETLTRSLSIEHVRAIAAWLKGYCHSKQGIETIAMMLFKDLIKL